jgi:hypothetical protein
MDAQSLKRWMTYQLALRVAKTAISALEKHGVRALPVKGMLLARQIYDPIERPISDVDLIVAPEDFSKVLRAARAAHWDLVWDSKMLGNVNLVVDRVAVDVMSSVGPMGVSATGVCALLDRAERRTDPLGFPHWQIDLHDHVVLLALDAFKDKLGFGKRWAHEDLVRIARRSGFSPAALMQRAADASLLTMLSIVADWVVSVGSTPEWVSVQKALRHVRLRQVYIQRYKRMLRVRSTSAWQQWQLSALTRAVSDSRPRRAIALTLGAIGAAQFLMRHKALDAKPWDAVRWTGRE